MPRSPAMRASRHPERPPLLQLDVRTGILRRRWSASHIISNACLRLVPLVRRKPRRAVPRRDAVHRGGASES
jgi:hypothetical protein